MHINVVPTIHLLDKHLVDEYRTIPKVLANIKSLYTKGKCINDIKRPLEYTLGRGHIRFFYDKLDWIIARYGDIHEELLRRGMPVDEDKSEAMIGDAIKCAPESWRGLQTYVPTPEAIYTNMSRLLVRSDMACVEKEVVDAFERGDILDEYHLIARDIDNTN